MDCSAKAGGGSYHNNRIFPSGAALSTCLGLGEMVQSGGTQARHLGRSQTGLQGVGMLNMTILPEKPTNPERVLSVIDDRQHLKKKSAGRHWLLHRISTSSLTQSMCSMPPTSMTTHIFGAGWASPLSNFPLT